MSSDYQLEDTLYLPFTTRQFSDGVPTVLAGTPAIDIYEDVTATPIITGETLAVSLNSVVGFNMITVTATAATGFGAGQSYTAIIQAGTVGGVSVVGEVVAHFTLDMSAAAKDLANATDGLGALKTLVDTVNTDLSNATDGLGALKTLIDTVNTDLSNGTDGLGALKTLIDTVNTDLSNGTDGLGALKTGIDAIPTTAMRGTDNAALASVVGALNDAAVGGDPTATDTVMQYIKQLVNVLVGTAGVVTFPAAAAPGNAVSLAEIIRSIYDDSNELQGDWVDAGRLDAILDARMAEASINTTGGAVDTVTTATTATNLTNAATAGDLTAAMKTSVNAEVDTALATTTYGEPAQGAPAATASLKDKIGYLYKGWRNRSNQTSTTYQLFNDDASTVDHKATVSDDGTTAEKGEVATGP